MRIFTEGVRVKVVTFCFVMVLFSCSKEYSKSSATTDSNPNELNRKWEIEQLANSTVESIEFLYNNIYLIKFSNGTLRKGTYSMEASGSRINLSGFGALTINDLTDKNLSFDLFIDGGSIIKGLKSFPTPLINTKATMRQIISQPWVVYKTILDNGQSYDTTYFPQTFQNSEGLIHVDVIFSPSGTYLVTNIRKLATGVDTSYLYRGWKWHDSAQTELKYFDIPASSDSGIAKIVKLTEDSLDMQDEIGYYFTRK